MQRGYSLLEVLVATSIVIVGVAALAQLIGLSTRANTQSRQTTVTTVLAQQKFEELLPEAATSLPASPAGTLGHNVDGFFDFVDGRGVGLGGGATPPAGTAYLRRWSIEALPGSPHNARILQVLVTDLRDRGAADTATAVLRLPGEARIVGATTSTVF